MDISIDKNGSQLSIKSIDEVDNKPMSPPPPEKAPEEAPEKAPEKAPEEVAEKDPEEAA